MTAFIITVVILAALTAIGGVFMLRAPRGWQDSDGFHLGDEP